MERTILLIKKKIKPLKINQQKKLKKEAENSEVKDIIGEIYFTKPDKNKTNKNKPNKEKLKEETENSELKYNIGGESLLKQTQKMMKLKNKTNQKKMGIMVKLKII